MKRDAGFTLIEALASLTILAMVSAMLLSGVGGGRRVWERLETRTAAGESVETAQAILRSRLERAYPATRYDASTPYVDFEGHRETAIFLGAEGAGSGGRILRQTLRLSPRGELLVGDAAAPSVLLTGVKSLELSYFGVSSIDPAPRWQDSWESLPEPPKLIRLRVAFQSGDRRVWPELLVRPAADVGVACLLDKTTRRCRGQS